MKTETVERQVVSSGSKAQTSFAISEVDGVHLIRILRSTLYTDKALAVLREYSANAWDEHRDAGCPDRPIKVRLPTELDKTLRIRDFGRGLSWDEIREVYTMYGASTKRNSNQAVGSMGIGSKSAFCYSDTYTVTSYHGGKKSIYIAMLDESDMGRMELFYEEDSDEPTGIEISVPIQPYDLHVFRRTAKWFFYYMDPQPDINIELQKPEMEWKGKEGFWGRVVDRWGHTSNDWVAVMGCVPYRIDLGQVLQDDNGPTKGGPPLSDSIQRFLKNRSGGFYFKIGEIRISANREEVEYTEATLKTIKNRIREMMDRMTKETMDRLRNVNTSAWDRRQQVLFYVDKTGLPLGKQYADLLTRRVPLYEDDHNPKTFVLYDVETTNTGAYRALRMSQDIRMRSPHILIKDIKAAVKPYAQDLPMVVIPADGATVGQVRKELEKLLKEADLDGMPIKKMSDVTPVVLPTPTGRTDNAKHRETYFVLKDRVRNTTPYSDNWDTVSRVPTDQDVFVVINRFVGVRYAEDFFSYVREQKSLCKKFGIDFPTVYGVKTTARNPVFEEDVPGIELREWMAQQSRKFLKDHPEYGELIKAHRWHGVFGWGYSSPTQRRKKIREFLMANLDGRHSLCRFIDRYCKMYDLVDKTHGVKRELAQHFVTLTADDRWADRPQKNLEKLYATYPLINPDNGGPGLGVFGVTNYRTHWLDYIRLVDKEKKS